MIGMLQGKIWGTTKCIFCINNVEIHRIDVKKHGYCSQHKHVSKYNLFYVESGKLKVTIFRDENENFGDNNEVQISPKLTDSTILTDGMSTIVPPGLKHMFEAVDDTIAYEIYWIDLDQSDIIRYVEGGMGT